MTDNHETLADYFARGGKICRITKVTYDKDGGRTTEMELRGPSLPDLEVTAALDADLAVTEYSATTVELEPETGEAPHTSLFVWVQAALIAAIRADSFESSYKMTLRQRDRDKGDLRSLNYEVDFQTRKAEAAKRIADKARVEVKRQAVEIATLEERLRMVVLHGPDGRDEARDGTSEHCCACIECRNRRLQGEVEDLKAKHAEYNAGQLASFRAELGRAADALTQAQARIYRLERELAESGDRRRRHEEQVRLARELLKCSPGMRLNASLEAQQTSRPATGGAA